VSGSSQEVARKSFLNFYSACSMQIHAKRCANIFPLQIVLNFLSAYLIRKVVILLSGYTDKHTK
jgi:hypothetical protein